MLLGVAGRGRERQGEAVPVGVERERERVMAAGGGLMGEMGGVLPAYLIVQQLANQTAS